jgi:hypothetical protein
MTIFRSHSSLRFGSLEFNDTKVKPIPGERSLVAGCDRAPNVQGVREIRTMLTPQFVRATESPLAPKRKLLNRHRMAC